MWSASKTVPRRPDVIGLIDYILEVAGVFVSYHLLDEFAARLPGVWAILCRSALPVLLILGWSHWSPQPWKIRDMGLARPAGSGWLEGLWLLAFQTTFLMGILLGIARFRFYSLFDFLIQARNRLNCYPADYGAFVFAIALFALLYFAWGGELLCRGLAQGLGTIRSNAAAGAVISWLVFAGMAMFLALRLGYPVFPAALLWGLFALFPGPVCEAYYFRNRSILPLVAVRTTSCTLAFAGVGFFLYWYPDRSFSTALPLAWTFLFALLLISIIGARRLLPFWQTASTMIQVGVKRALLPAAVLATIIVLDGHIRRPAIRLMFCLALLSSMFYLRTRKGGFARTETTTSEPGAQEERPD